MILEWITLASYQMNYQQENIRKYFYVVFGLLLTWSNYRELADFIFLGLDPYMVVRRIIDGLRPR